MSEKREKYDQISAQGEIVESLILFYQQFQLKMRRLVDSFD